MKLICENSNSLHINTNGVRSDAADTIGLLDTLLPLCTLDNNNNNNNNSSNEWAESASHDMTSKLMHRSIIICISIM